MTDEQKQALAKILNLLNPPIVVQLATQGTRQNWQEIAQLAAMLEPLLQPAPAEPKQ